MKSTINILTCYYDKCGCYDEEQYVLDSLLDYQHLVHDISTLSLNNENDYARVFIRDEDNHVKEITLKNSIFEAEIKEDWSTGKSVRTFSCCGKDCTNLTMWMWPKYCPWCGAKIKEKN